MENYILVTHYMYEIAQNKITMYTEFSDAWLFIYCVDNTYLVCINVHVLLQRLTRVETLLNVMVEHLFDIEMALCYLQGSSVNFYEMPF